MNDPVFGEEELRFPVECLYKVIMEDASGDGAERISSALKAIGVMVPVEAGNHSSAGRYTTFNIRIFVQSKERMYEIDALLREIRGVRMVL